MLRAWMNDIKRIRDSDNGISLVELLVAATLIAVVTTSIGLAFGSVITIQHNTEATDKAVQVARDYVERTKQAHFSTLGFYDYDTGFRATGPGGLPTVVIAPDRPSTGLIPLDKKSVGGAEYEVRTDITSPSVTDEYAPKTITVTVSWRQDNGATTSTSVSYVRSPTAAERIPPWLDVTTNPGLDGVPSAPTFFDDGARLGGTVSAAFGRAYRVRVILPGNPAALTGLRFAIQCSSDSPDEVVVDMKSTEGAPFTAPSGWTATASGNEYTLSYYTKPANLPCNIEMAHETTVNAINVAGVSPPLTLQPQNFDILSY